MVVWVYAVQGILVTFILSLGKIRQRSKKNIYNTSQEENKIIRIKINNTQATQKQSKKKRSDRKKKRSDTKKRSLSTLRCLEQPKRLNDYLIKRFKRLNAYL